MRRYRPRPGKAQVRRLLTLARHIGGHLAAGVEGVARALIDEAVGRIDGRAQAVDRIVPDLDLGPVVGGRDVHDGDVLLHLAAAAAPVGVGHAHDPVGQNVGNDGDMAAAHPAFGAEDQDRTGLGGLARAELLGGLTPPGPGVAEDVDAREHAGEGHALPVGLVSLCMGGNCAQCKKTEGRRNRGGFEPFCHAEAVSQLPMVFLEHRLSGFDNRFRHTAVRRRMMCRGA